MYTLESVQENENGKFSGILKVQTDYIIPARKTDQVLMLYRVKEEIHI